MFTTETAADDIAPRHQDLNAALALSALPVAVYTIDRDGRLTFYNERAAELWGRRPILGQDRWCGSFRLLNLDGTPLPHEECPMATLVREGQRVRGQEIIIERPDGTRRHVLPQADLLHDATGEVVGAINLVVDITDRKIVEEVLQRSGEHFRQLADALPNIVWTARPDGRLDYCNERWYEFTGVERHREHEDAMASIMHSDDQARATAAWREAIRTGTPFQCEFRCQQAAGGYRWFLGRAVPVRDEYDNVVRWFGTCTDIDDTKRAEETTRFLADASAALADVDDYERTLERVVSLAVPFFADWSAVDVLTPEGTLRRVAVKHSDPERAPLAYEIMVRYPPSPTNPVGAYAVLRTGEPNFVAESTDEMVARYAKDDEHLRMMRGLGIRSYIGVPIRARSMRAVLTFVMAQSGRRYRRGDLHAAQDLADRAAIAIDNASLVRALREADRRKDEFLAMLAHELRNPLAPVRHAVQILRAKGPPAPDLQWAQDIIDRQVKVMSRLVDDLLDVSRITRGKIELRRERVALATVLGTAVEASRPTMETWGHELTVVLPPEPVYLDADVPRLAQVLTNLLDNAAKYTEHGGRIRLEAQRENGQVVIRVRDTGIGIPSEMLAQVFEMFTQLDRSLERSRGGLGIGLTLVKRLIELHGGTVEAHSNGPGQGSEFVIRLPVAESEDSESPTSMGNETPSASSGLRILVVDDNRDAGDSLSTLLRLRGHDVRTAYDGVDALGEASVFHPDVMLIDIGLPRLHGCDVARRMRAERGSDVLLIAVTGWGQAEDRERSRDAGFDHHLTKPVELDALETLIMAAHEERATKGT